MSATKDGGPMFPTSYPGLDPRAPGWIGGGIPVRDWFAGMAMQGILSDPSSTSRGCAQAVAQLIGEGKVPVTFIRIVAEASYLYADAMLAEREKVRP